MPLLGLRYGQADQLTSISSGNSLSTLRNYRAGRESSFDRTGGNADWIPVAPGASATLAEISGPGMITHIWTPIGRESPKSLKQAVLRIYWDGEEDPSVEVPVGDFFGQPLGDYVDHYSALLGFPPWSGLNSYFPMPFAKSARITLNNDRKDSMHIYSHVDYISLDRPPEGVGYFHAQYRQYTPASQSELGGSEIVTLEAEGRGHIVGFSRGFVLGPQEQIRTARELLQLDGSAEPLVDFSFRPNFDVSQEKANCSPVYSYEFEGKPYVIPGIDRTGRYYSYRWFMEAPPTFSRSAKASIATPDRKALGSEIYSTVYWYQAEPHKTFPALPKLEDRVPRSLANIDSPARAGTEEGRTG